MGFNGKNNSAKGWLLPLKRSVPGPRFQFTKTTPETRRARVSQQVPNWAVSASLHGDQPVCYVDVKVRKPCQGVAANVGQSAQPSKEIRVEKHVLF